MSSDSCSSDASDGCYDKDLALKLRIGALISILIASAIGVSFPIIGKSYKALRPQRDIFFIVKAFAAGVILATGFVHVLPDAFESLTSECLKENPWAKFPFAGFISMVAAMLTSVIDYSATAFYERIARTEQEGHKQDHDSTDHHDNGVTHVPVHSHVHTHEELEAGNTKLRQRVVSQVLEVGIVAHSVIIGIALGASEVPCTIRPLVAALTFHQFFEGMGLGSCIAQGGFKMKAASFMALAFSFTTPVGIVVGIGISSTYNENSQTALVVQGLFDAASSGILIYMALVDLMAADFLTPRMRKNPGLQMWCYAALFLGAGAMALLAVWA
ncbi:hypothetical protein SUGI_0315040 [Cryptomeria japonica]|uniref:ZIP Zinc transporter n=1 Tax=Cryptomeria japonica TaxID=3369 RepID=A0A1V1FYQ2_CRYJA|nr:zinc transporter 1 [Cryptomeria japonica]BAX09094.1 ZIP Zinc transporter [Cryptomeria japonica]GLJ17946.1 hypothetical protein SUGI_0315040 [Cryptomeria japonica]